MSATLNIVLDYIAEDASVKDQRKFYGQHVRAALEDEKRAAITAGCYLNLAFGTFSAEELKDGKWAEWATGATRKSIKTVESYMAVGKAYSTSTKTLQSKIKDWTFEAMQAYASVPATDRNDVVAAVLAEDSNPSPELVRTARDIAKDEKLTPAERAEKDAAKRKRDKQRAEDKTVEMVKTLSPILNRFKTDQEFKAFLVGVEMGIAHKDAKLIESAVKSYRTVKDAAVEKDAKRIKREAENLVASAA